MSHCGAIPGEASRPERVEGDPPAVEEASAAPLVIRRRGRRVTTDASPGYAGEPAIERSQSRENDARLREDVPPHWG